MMKRLLLFLAAAIPAVLCSGREAFSYLYIQGDKETPFYVKLEDAMQPRYGKNYCIIPQLAPGAVHIEVLFQQNVFPSRQFTVLIPDGGSRGFLLVKKDTSFALYDLQQGFYLTAGNAEADDRLPVAGTIAKTIQQSAIEPQTLIQREAANAHANKKPKATKVKNKPIAEIEQLKTEGPQFIPGIELKQSIAANDGAPTPHTMGQTSVTAITNSDCPSAISSADFGKIFSAMSASSGDEERLGYVLGKLDVCYESWQARALAGMLGTDAARFTLLKKIYPRIADQGAFPLLDDLLTSETWKAEFARLLHH